VSIKELLNFGKTEVDSVDAELLLAHLLGVSRMELHSRVIELPVENLKQIEGDYKELLAIRRTGRPTQYITGVAPFRYLEYEVGEGVLIPRPETELLVDEVLHQLQKFDDPVSVVDLGAGAGGISIALATETFGKKDIRVIAVEKSDDALVWLQKNIAKHQADVRVVHSDVRDALMGIKCDVVVANPPYLPEDIDVPDELGFEPDVALYGGARGIEIPAIFIECATRLLKSGGFLAMEHHEDQGKPLAQLLSENFRDIRLHLDLNERPRFTTAWRL
jgi:release factor glutamine methyltransferase